MEIHSFIGPFPRFPVNFLESVKKITDKVALKREI